MKGKIQKQVAIILGNVHLSFGQLIDKDFEFLARAHNGSG